MNKENNSFRDGWFQTAEGKEIFTKATSYGTVMFTLDKKELDAIIREAFFRVIDITDVPKTPDEIAIMMGFEPDGNPSRTSDPEDADYINEVKMVLQEAERYVRDNLPAVLDTVLWFFAEEAVLSAIVKRAGKGFFDLGMTQLEAFKRMKTRHFDDLKKRMNIIKATGAKKKWTDGKQLALLEFYEKLQPLTRAAKKTYRRVRKFDNWKDRIKDEHPALPQEIIELLPGSERDGEPGLIVLTYASSLFDGAKVGYMIKQLARARRARAARGESQKNPGH